MSADTAARPYPYPDDDSLERPPYPRGRAVRMTAAIAAGVLEKIAAGASRDEAAAEYGYSGRTVQRYAERHPDYREKLDAVLAQRGRRR